MTRSIPMARPPPQNFTDITVLTRTYLKSFARVARWRLAYTVALMVAASLTEGIGLALLLPTLQLAGVDIGQGSEAGRYADRFRAALGTIGLRPTLVVMLALFVAVVCARAMLNLGQGVAIESLQQRFVHDLRRRLFDAVSAAQWLFICKSRAVDFVHALTVEADRAGIAAYQSLWIVSAAAITALYATVSMILFPATTMLMLGLCAVIALLMRARTRAVHRAGTELSDTGNLVYGAAIEHFQSLKTAKMYGAQRRTGEIFSCLSRDMAAASVGMVREQLSADAWFDIGSALMAGGVLVFAIKLFGISAAEVLILFILFARVVPRVRSLQSYYHGFVSEVPGFATVTELGRAMPCRSRTGRWRRATARVALRRALRESRLFLSGIAGAGLARA